MIPETPVNRRINSSTKFILVKKFFCSNFVYFFAARRLRYSRAQESGDVLPPVPIPQIVRPMLLKSCLTNN